MMAPRVQADVPDPIGLHAAAAWSRSSIVSVEDDTMRFIHLFLTGYLVLIVGVGVALWQIGVLNRVAPIWIAIGLIVAVGVGMMASVSSGRPAISTDQS